MLDGGHDDTLTDAVIQRQLQAVGALADLLCLDDLADAQIQAAEVVNVDLRLDGLHGIGVAVDLLLHHFFHDLRLSGLSLGHGGGEVQQLQITLGLNGIQEQVQTRATLLVDEQLVDRLEEVRKEMQRRADVVESGGNMFVSDADVALVKTRLTQVMKTLDETRVHMLNNSNLA